MEWNFYETLLGSAPTPALKFLRVLWVTYKLSKPGKFIKLRLVKVMQELSFH